jgi:hypothetical protein
MSWTVSLSWLLGRVAKVTAGVNTNWVGEADTLLPGELILALVRSMRLLSMTICEPSGTFSAERSKVSEAMVCSPTAVFGRVKLKEPTVFSEVTATERLLSRYVRLRPVPSRRRSRKPDYVMRAYDGCGGDGRVDLGEGYGELGIRELQRHAARGREPVVGKGRAAAVVYQRRGERASRGAVHQVALRIDEEWGDQLYGASCYCVDGGLESYCQLRTGVSRRGGVLQGGL